VKRIAVSLEQLASLDNLARAYRAAAKGSPRVSEIEVWQSQLDAQLALLRCEILQGTFVQGPYRRFRIRDPKPRVIQAPSFRQRVLHHAVIALVGPLLDRTLGYDTYACRKGKGAHAAVKRAQTMLRCYPWYVQIDIRSYFASVDQERLKALLRRRIKGQRVLELLDAIIGSHHDGPGRGLPIGALTSQHFANFYLAGLDRHLQRVVRALGMVRYMDDVVWWCRSQAEAEQGLESARQYLRRELALEIKASARIVPSYAGLKFCGFHIFRSMLRLSKRRRRRYAAARARWESAYRLYLIDERSLQQGYASANAITAHADALGFRREQLRRVPVRFEC